jgi:superfamily I DNA/RNA helicase
MNHWDSIRLQAREVRAQAMETSGGDASPDALLRALAEITRIKSQGLPKGHNLLFGAKATIDTYMVWFDRDVEQWEQYFNQVHEYAHYFRHGRNFICGGDDINSQATEDAVNMGAQCVDGYGPHERRELEANVFALEFLLPGNELRGRFLAGNNAEKIAAESQMHEPMVIHALLRAILGVELQVPQKSVNAAETEGESRDDDQDEAVFAGEEEIAEHLPPKTILVDAGPGTGKTKTLIKRIARLTGHRRVPASKILALTFSNKAAEEIYVRANTQTDRDLSQAWMGTFHKFGLDLIRKYYKRLGLTPNPKVLDTLDARLLLEQNLGELNLRHFRSLDHPNKFLRTILDRVSRAKDDLIGPGELLQCAEAHYESVKNNRSVGKDILKKAAEDLEVAQSYAVYQKLLQSNNQLDYGDLIARSVELLSQHEDVLKKEQERFEHILIDEYQDVNHASRILLKLLAGEGHGLWVVGDLRQAIYRFRGASPRNMTLLTSEDFENSKTIRLGSNYRSQEPVVTVFEGCATKMRSDGTEEKWEARRILDGKSEVRYLVSSDEKTEIADLVSEIQRLQENGVEYRDQAVLCRYHNDLATLSDALENAGIPVLYLGNFFERPEIRDLLSIVALATESDGRALYRLANFGEFSFSRDDIKLFTDHVYKNQIRFPVALKNISEVEGLSPEGKDRLQIVADHFEEFHFGNSAWHVLSQYLFVKSDYLRLLAADDSVRGQQKRLAIYQLLLFAYQLKDDFSEPGRKGDKKWHFLNYLRQIRIDKEDRQLRQPPNWADDINAVRLMTIHTAKGLEWSAVHLPMLSDGKFPRRTYTDLNQGKSQNTPVEIDSRDEEENCLFFVALSRAKNHLSLYRARKYGFKEGQQSRLIQLIAKQIPRAICRPLERVPPPPRVKAPTPVVNVKREYNARELSVYLKCPLEYEYRYVMGLSSQRSDEPIGKTYLAVFRVGEAIKKAQASGQKITTEFVEGKIAEVWAECGPVAHPYEPDYHSEARQMIQRIFERDPKSEDRIVQPDWRVELSNGIVIVKPDYVDFFDEEGKMKVVVEKLNFGNSPEPFEEDDIYPLFEKAASDNFPEFERRVHATFMGDSKTVPLSIGQTWRRRSVANFERAINGILAEDFSPRVNDKFCPFCSYYVICSSND